MASREHGPDRFDYDALESRAFVWDSYSQLAVLRSLEVEWSWFNSNPASAVTEVVGLVRLEDFLDGATFDGVPSAVVEEARAYVLGVRIAGASTLVEVTLPELEGRLGAWVVWIDGAACEHPGVPGPAYAGVVDAREHVEAARVVRRLVAPGLRRIRVSALVHTDVTRERVASVEVMIARGSIVRLVASFEAHEVNGRLAEVM